MEEREINAPQPKSIPDNIHIYSQFLQSEKQSQRPEDQGTLFLGSTRGGGPELLVPFKYSLLVLAVLTGIPVVVDSSLVVVKGGYGGGFEYMMISEWIKKDCCFEAQEL